MSAIGPPAGLLVASLWFAVVHPSPVEYPGLALAGEAAGLSLPLEVVETGREHLREAVAVALSGAGV